MASPSITTIQVGRGIAELLRRRYPGQSYNDALNTILGVSAGPAGGTTIQRTVLIPFSRSVASLRTGEQTERVAAPGYVLAAYFHYPSGTSALVEVRVMRKVGVGGDEPIIPNRANSFIALDNFTLSLEGLWVSVSAGDSLRVEWNNYDGANAHRVPVEIIIGET